MLFLRFLARLTCAMGAMLSLTGPPSSCSISASVLPLRLWGAVLCGMCGGVDVWVDVCVWGGAVVYITHSTSTCITIAFCFCFCLLALLFLLHRCPDNLISVNHGVVGFLVYCYIHYGSLFFCVLL